MKGFIARNLSSRYRVAFLIDSMCEEG